MRTRAPATKASILATDPRRIDEGHTIASRRAVDGFKLGPSRLAQPIIQANSEPVGQQAPNRLN
jgi:hypothetical protein